MILELPFELLYKPDQNFIQSFIGLFIMSFRKHL